jgi:hypothetical protein
MYNLCPHMVVGGCEPCRRDHEIWMGRTPAREVRGHELPAIVVPKWYEVDPRATGHAGLCALREGVRRLGWQQGRHTLPVLAEKLPEAVRVRALARLADRIGYSVSNWETEPGRCEQDVLNLLDCTIEALERQGRAA